MHYDLTQQLKRLRAIEPDRRFVARSRNLILTPAPTAPVPLRWPLVAWATGGVAITATLVVLLATPQFSAPQRVLASSLNQVTLESEFNNLPINIQLQEISYNQSLNQTIASAIHEIGDSSTSHLNRDLLESEGASVDLNVDGGINGAIDQMLNGLTR